MTLWDVIQHFSNIQTIFACKITSCILTWLMALWDVVQQHIWNITNILYVQNGILHSNLTDDSWDVIQQHLCNITNMASYILIWLMSLWDVIEQHLFDITNILCLQNNILHSDLTDGSLGCCSPTPLQHNKHSLPIKEHPAFWLD